ncbi:MAG TPA: YetF domain-containing protein [Candidatus Limnocylindrales bacterium]
MFDVGPLFEFKVSPLELIVRATFVYAIFLIALRLSGKRELGQFTIFDLSLVLLAANALQPAITGPDVSLGGAMVIVLTLFLLNRAVAMARHRSPLLRRILDYAPTVIARDGQWDDRAIDREDLDQQDLESAIREHGLETVSEVKLAVLEHDGSISVVPLEGERLTMRSRRRRYRHRDVGET